MTARLKIISFNAQGLKSANKRGKMLNWANRKKFDIMNIQESHMEDKDINSWKEQWKGGIHHSSGSNNSRGVTTLIRKDLDHQIKGEHKDKNGRWIVLDICIKGKEYTIGNFYGPNNDDPQHIDDMLKKVEELDNANCILSGDFNFVFNPKIDKTGGTLKTNFKCRNTTVNWMEEKNMVDIWRLKNPTTRKYTWKSNTKPPVMCRLDFALVSESLMGQYHDSDIVPGFRSDHACVTLTLEDHEEQRGRGFWKFNSLLLKDADFKEELAKTIKETAELNNDSSSCLLWDTIKCTMRGKSVSHSSYNNKQKKCQIAENSDRLKKLETTFCEKITEDPNHNTIPALEQEIRELKSKIEEGIEEDTRGKALRAQCTWYEHGDTSSKFFLNLEKSRGNNKTIRRLKTEDGKLTTEGRTILQTEKNFYQKLYSSGINTKKTDTPAKEKRAKEDMFETTCPKYDMNNEEELTNQITEEEIWDIIKESPQNKSPGCDGFTNEFYKGMWPHVKKYMIAAFNEALERGELSTTQKRGVITLIPKPQKDLDDLKNWRPITLLNQDYKYLAKAIASRLKKTLSNIISSDQTGFISDRYIGCNIQRIQNLQSLCEENNINGALINIDFEKAFDSIEWEFIYKAMEHFGYPTKVINWCKTFYNNIETCIINNGNTTEFFHPERGVRQGCPLSPYLFIIAVEILSLWIKQNPNIDGIIDNQGGNYIISQFADDTSFAIRNNKNNLHKLFEQLTLFESASGLKLNVKKTEILLLGSAKPQDIPTKFRSNIKEEVKCLGINISKDAKTTARKNTIQAMEKMKSTLKTWSNRQISMAGKIAIVKSLVTSKLTYVLSTLKSPEPTMVTELNKIIYHFIYNSQTDKIKRSVLIAPYEEGGYKMIDIDSQNEAIKMGWMKRLITTDGTWKKYVVDKCKIDILYLSRCNIKYEDLPFKFPEDKQRLKK